VKLNNINPVVREMSFGELAVIALGERGRGRFEAVVPCGVKKDDKFGSIAKTKSGNPKIIHFSAPEHGWIAVVSGSGTYTRGTYGTVYCQKEDVEKVQVLALGNGAYGDAGRIGSWNEFLITITENTFLRIRPAGGQGKIDRHNLFFSAEKVFRIPDSELQIFCEQMGLDIPVINLDELVDLASLK
jgi:hypothetical protein